MNSRKQKHFKMPLFHSEVMVNNINLPSITDIKMAIYVKPVKILCRFQKLIFSKVDKV